MSSSSRPLVLYEGAERQISDVLAEVRGFAVNRRRAVLVQICDEILLSRENYADAASVVVNFVNHDSGLQASLGKDAFLSIFRDISDVSKMAEDQRNRCNEARETIRKAWGQEALNGPLKHAVSYNFLSAVRKLTAHPLPEVTARVNEALIERLDHPGRGIKNTTRLQPADFALAPTKSGRAISDQVVNKHGLGRHSTGFLVPNEDLPPRSGRLTTVGPEVANVGIRQAGESSALALRTHSRHASDVMNPSAFQPSTPVRGGGVSIMPSPSQQGSPMSVDSPLSSINESILAAGTPVGSPPRLPVSSSRRNPRRGLTVAHPEVGGLGVESMFDENVIEPGDDEEYIEEAADAVAILRAKRGCDCKDDVPAHLKASLNRTTKIEPTEIMKLLRSWYRAAGSNPEICKVCWMHTQAMGGRMGLAMKGLNYAALCHRLRLIYHARNHLGTIKTDPTTYSWFRKAHRPPVPSDSLGPYKFIHNSAPRFSYDREALLDRMLSPNDQDVWQREGSVVSNVFGWWWDSGISAMMEEEMRMYRHHQRLINGRPNYGWLRTMVHGLCQQLMRQDPQYYRLYCALRPDSWWRLISYPYYAKFAVEGDSTAFRHIDVNIPSLLESGRGADMIQGSVSLDDETEDNCTIILPGMHHHLESWWADLKARGLAKGDGFVHKISDQDWTTEDVEKYATDWVAQPCEKGDVRITMPHLPHGAKGPSTGTRRTMLPWFVGVQDDHDNLEVTEGGTWAELADAHRDLKAPPRTPSGHANLYGAIPYRFPAAVELTAASALSDALLGRRRWDSPAVIRDRDLLLTGNGNEVGKWMHSYRLRAVENYKDAFQLMRATEMERFDSRSYFYCVDNGIDPSTVAVDPSRVSPVVAEGQSHAELPEELWDRTEQMEGRERAISSESRQSDTSRAAQPGGRERSHSTRTESPRSPSRVRGKGKERMRSPAAPSFRR